MPAKHFFIERQVNKKSSKLPVSIHKRVDKVFDVLKENPLAGTRLKGELGFAYKYRIGDYRIVYTFDPKTSTLIVLKIEHRQGVYK
jgi:mRNA-degrading endonuclease RelE of RelBE toxin-antitoxin system